EDHQPLVDRKTVTLLKQAGERAAVYTTGAFMGLRNALVLTASKLGQIPPWLYRDNPAFQLVTVPRPDLRERKIFIDLFLTTSFRIEDRGIEEAPERRQRLVDDLAGLSDGLSYVDLEALGRTSEREGLAADQPTALVNYFRFGTRVDPWQQFRDREPSDFERRLAAEVFGQPAAIAAA